jgi:hypothetical protein
LCPYTALTLNPSRRERLEDTTVSNERTNQNTAKSRNYFENFDEILAGGYINSGIDG